MTRQAKQKPPGESGVQIQVCVFRGGRLNTRPPRWSCRKKCMGESERKRERERGGGGERERERGGGERERERGGGRVRQERERERGERELDI